MIQTFGLSTFYRSNMNKEYILKQIQLYRNYPRYCEYLLTIYEHIRKVQNERTTNQSSKNAR